MKSLVLVFCLAQLCGCHSALLLPDMAPRELNCDDPESEQAALVAVDYINKNLIRGYKHTLNQIDKVKVWPRRPMGEVFEIEIDTLETTCHALDPTPVANCSVRQLRDHAVEGDCDFHVLKQDGQFSVLFAKCDSSPDSKEDVLKVCAGCPLLVQFNDTKVVQAVEAALAAFNSRTDGSYFQLVEVSRAQRATPSASSTYVEFAVAATDCIAKEVTDPAKCNLLEEKQYGFCKGTVSEKAGEAVAVTCTPFQTQPQADNTNAPTPAAASAGPMSPPADLPAASAAPLVEAVPQPALPVNRAYHDLRHTFTGAASVESASGEMFYVGKPPKLVQPSMAVSSVPALRPCPGRVRHFKI